MRLNHVIQAIGKVSARPKLRLRWQSQSWYATRLDAHFLNPFFSGNGNIIVETAMLLTIAGRGVVLVAVAMDVVFFSEICEPFVERGKGK
jgi:hypothetical protein